MSIYTILDTAFDLVMTVLGVILIRRAAGNRMMLFWGVLSILIGVIFLRDNIELWLHPGLPAASHGHGYSELLVPERMLEWFAPAVAVSLFPLMSLRPGFLTPVRIVLFSIPVVVTLLVGWCYLAFNGYLTPLYSLADVWDTIDQMDVRLRLGILAMTVIVPTAYFVTPTLWRLPDVHRKSTPAMRVFILGMLTCVTYYTIYMLWANFFLFSTVNLVIEGFSIVFSVAFLMYENPLSAREAVQPSQPEGPQSPAAALYARMENHFKQNHPFVNPDYSIEMLARELGARPSQVADAIQSGGFTAFREYANYLKVQYFKTIARAQRGRSVKELMNESGFSSRSSFYRLFALYENTTPSEFIEKLYLEQAPRPRRGKQGAKS